MRLHYHLFITAVFLLLQLYGQHSLENDALVTPYTIYDHPTLIPVKAKVDSIMEEAIRAEAFPGAQFLVAKGGEVIFHETYGFHTYDSLHPVGRSDLYDLASVTKIAGPLPALMKLAGEGKIDLDAPLSRYWPDWEKDKEKSALTLREILAHQAGLKPYIAFMNDLGNREEPNKKYLRSAPDAKHNVKVSDGLYLSERFYKQMYREIRRSPVATDKTYTYSGLSFLLYPAIIQNLTEASYRSYVRKSVYEPIGAHTLMFTPEGWYPDRHIVPTEIDTLFRKQLVKGSVHDENAAIMGGVSGNAGLFGTAVDLARLMQLYLNKGEFNGQRILREEVMNEFTRVQFPENGNRRGLGFDKPLLDNETLPLSEAYPAPGASASSFGHSGFTGTFVWADPEGEWVFVFLSNRVYPNRSHRKLYSLKVRERLMQVFYDGFDAEMTK